MRVRIPKVRVPARLKKVRGVVILEKVRMPRFKFPRLHALSLLLGLLIGSAGVWAGANLALRGVALSGYTNALANLVGLKIPAADETKPVPAPTPIETAQAEDERERKALEEAETRAKENQAKRKAAAEMFEKTCVDLKSFVVIAPGTDKPEFVGCVLRQGVSWPKAK